MGVVQKKFSRRRKHKLSSEEKLERDLKTDLKGSQKVELLSENGSKKWSTYIISGVLGDFSPNQLHEVTCGHKVRIWQRTGLCSGL